MLFLPENLYGDLYFYKDLESLQIAKRTNTYVNDNGTCSKQREMLFGVEMNKNKQLKYVM